MGPAGPSTGSEGIVASPATDTSVGLPTALWAMDRVAALLSAELGVNVTVTSWDWPASTVKLSGATLNSAAS